MLGISLGFPVRGFLIMQRFIAGVLELWGLKTSCFKKANTKRKHE
jgi:hypothetical protein